MKDSIIQCYIVNAFFFLLSRLQCLVSTILTAHCRPIQMESLFRMCWMLNGDRCRFRFIMISFIFGLENRTNLFIFLFFNFSFNFYRLGFRLIPSILLLFLIHVFNLHFDECPFVLVWFLPNGFVWIVCLMFDIPFCCFLNASILVCGKIILCAICKLL